MRLATAVVAMLAAQTATAHAATMQWCRIPALLPATESDFDRITPLIEDATGCARRPTDSAHQVTWKCDGDTATPDPNPMFINLSRVPGQGANLTILGLGIESLDALRRCNLPRVNDGTRFKAGNVAHRDELTFDYGTKTMTLLNMLPGEISVIYHAGRFADHATTGDIAEAIFGIEPVAFPRTAVRLAGADPLATDVYALVEAFRRRGSTVTSVERNGDATPLWRLTPPTGLPGVTGIEITGFIRHLLHASYRFTNVADYERYVGLLDAEYGASRRSVDGQCVVRSWTAGQITIVGRHCRDAGTKLVFMNTVAGDQLSSFLDMKEREEARSPTPNRPTIDRDNF